MTLYIPLRLKIKLKLIRLDRENAKSRCGRFKMDVMEGYILFKDVLAAAEAEINSVFHELLTGSPDPLPWR